MNTRIIIHVLYITLISSTVLLNTFIWGTLVKNCGNTSKLRHPI